MRMPVTKFDLSSGLFTRSARLLSKRWPFKLRGLAQSQNVLAAAMGYRDFHDLQQYARAGAPPRVEFDLRDLQRAFIANLTASGKLRDADARALAEALPLGQFGSLGARSPVTPPFPIFRDEFWDEEARESALTEWLCGLKMVPSVRYFVHSGRVFVFKKLLGLAADFRGLTDSLPPADKVAEWVHECMLSPLEAVRDWGVVPEPFFVSRNREIVHRELNASVPGSFVDQDAMNTALATLLSGDVAPGTGEFMFRGQTLNLVDPVRATDLPPFPAVLRHDHAGAQDSNDTRAQTTTAFVAGFSPVTAQSYAELQRESARWTSARQIAFRVAQDNVGSLWASEAPQMRWDAKGFDAQDWHDPNAAAALRGFFPELTAMSDVELYYAFDAFREAVYTSRGWEPDQDPAFMWFMLAKAHGCALARDQSEDDIDLGKWAVYARTVGAATSDIPTLCAEAVRYGKALSSMVCRVDAAMAFVRDAAEDAAAVASWEDAVQFVRGRPNRAPYLRATALYGAEVVTLKEIFRRSRSVNVTIVHVEQSADDLEATAQG
ncbi:hypothetical protein RAS12_30955 (plasmid) [Achromobacter seleniivolatilans]|uniref:Uncharacterized protein n=1 Tax=Achromobacter seleniivolatilans TaxID=3047478 RepID=A0ABY9MAN7_9BURK|nr:hypothetical protein [Achromobacter sp. R39]WMD24054.1 hypothetical protein RAS12_30955 [Achromobacter sp. R39]